MSETEKKLRARLAEIEARITALMDRLAGGETLTDAENGELDKANTLAEELHQRLADLAVQEARRGKAEKLHPADPESVDPQLQAPAADKAAASIGKAFVDSPEFKDYLPRKAGTSKTFSTKFALIKSVDAEGHPIGGVHRAAPAGAPTVLTPLLDAMGFEPVSSNAIEYVRFPVARPEAEIVAEAATKPEATFPPILVEATLEKIAHHIPITAEALEDFERMEAIVSGALVDGVRLKAERRAAEILEAETDIPLVEGESLLAAIRVGIATVQDKGFQPRSVVINPFDYAQIDLDLLTKTLNGALREVPLWALDVIPAGKISRGTAIVGDLLTGGRVFARSQVQVRMTDSHAEEFVDNILRILAEQRVLTDVVRPEALARCRATPAAATAGTAKASPRR